ncbi:MAG: hypothetical protein K9K36_07155 [Desulfarculaceae bacterium]|nr:hypothetical protein [Desulfarculaceae bacterium]MCF8124502.1 hypothetical protein [Desulfarculaceae bacterium]
MSDCKRGEKNPYCPHCDEVVKVERINLQPADQVDGPAIRGACWNCPACQAHGPIKPSEAEAWESLRTLDAIQLAHYRTWHKALSEAQGGPCADWMGRVLLEDCGLAMCECGDLCPEEEITRDGDGVELCPPCWAALIEECEARQEKDGA